MPLAPIHRLYPPPRQTACLKATHKGPHQLEPHHLDDGAELGLWIPATTSPPLSDDEFLLQQSNLPLTAMQALLGRRHDWQTAPMRAVREVLATPEVRLLVLTGPPGIGKGVAAAAWHLHHLARAQTAACSCFAFGVATTWQELCELSLHDKHGSLVAMERATSLIIVEAGGGAIPESAQDRLRSAVLALVRARNKASLATCLTTSASPAQFLDEGSGRATPQDLTRVMPVDGPRGAPDRDPGPIAPNAIAQFLDDMGSRDVPSPFGGA